MTIRKLVARILMLVFVVLTINFFYWTVYWELWYWQKPLEQSILDSWQNWILLFVSLTLTAFLSTVEIKPIHKEEIEVVVKGPKGITISKMFKEDIEKVVGLPPPVGIEVVKIVPAISSIESKPTEAVSTTKTETYKPAVTKCPKCKQPVIEANLTKIINHAEGTIEYLSPCCQEIIKKVKMVE